MFLKQDVKIYSLLLVIILPILIKTTNKNTCHSYFDYLLINFNGNCYYNPDVDLEVPELIEKYTENLKIYNVTTQDGYKLTMFRIFRQNPIGVILLQPPMSAGSIAYISDGNQSIAFSLWNMGYDVWLSNHRGASYSRQHVNFTEADPGFWDYSFHEIGLYDLEAQFDLIQSETNGSKVTFVGYSLSSTIALVYASVKSEEAQKNVNAFILFAPASVLNNFKSPFKIIFYFMAPFEKYFRLGEFMTMEVVRWICQKLTIIPFILNIATSIVMGWTPTEMDPALYPYIFAHHGRGITNKMVYHYSQIVDSHGHFPMYDYGIEENVKVYGSEVPPDYPLDKISTPVYVLYGERDLLAAPEDVETLCEDLIPKDQLRGKILISNYNHIDFFFSRHRRKKTFENIYKILRNIYVKSDF